MSRKYPSLYLLFFIIGGIVAADLTHASSWLLFTGALLSIIGGLVSFGLARRGRAMVCLGLGIGFLGALQFALANYEFGDRHLARTIDESKTCHLFGSVSDWPDIKSNGTEIRIAVDSLGGEISRAVEGSVLLKITDTTTALQIGDRVEFHGRIYPVRADENSGSGFDYRRYLNLKGVYGIVYLPTLLDVRIDRRYQYGFLSITDGIRRRIAESFHRDLSPEAAALASGFLIGETRNISSDVYQMFRQSGTLHLLAVSGSNVALVLLFVGLMLRPLGLSRRKRALILLIVLGLFTLLSYGQPSVIRASVMAALVILAALMERRYDLNNVIALSMLIILIVNPAELYDVGFQLSYATAWGLIFFVPRVGRLFEKWHNTRGYRWLAFPIIISLVAQVVSAPLTMLYFGRVPVLSVFANLIIVPLTSVAVLGSMAVLIANLLWPTLGVLVGSLLTLLLDFEVGVVRVFGSSDLPSLNLGLTSSSFLSVAGVILFYGFLMALVLAITGLRARRAVVLLAFIAVNAGLVTVALRRTESGERLKLMTIPGGIAAVRYHAGANTGDLLLTGMASKEYSVSERILAPWLKRLGISSLDQCLVLSAEYNSLRDLFSIDDSIHVEHYCFRGSLRQTVADVLSERGNALMVSSVQFYPEGSWREGVGERLVCRRGRGAPHSAVRGGAF